MVDFIVACFENVVGQPIVTQELPDVLDRTELGRARRQREDGDVVGQFQLLLGVPVGLIHDHAVVSVRGDGV